MLVAEYDIVYMIRKAIKGSTIVDHMVNRDVKDYEPLNFDLPDEDVLPVKDDGEMNN